MDALFPALYATIKYAAYTGWCYLGIRLFDAACAHKARWAFLCGFIRLAMGLGFGVLIFILGLLVYEATRVVGRSDAAPAVLSEDWFRMAWTYLTVYVPVRWVEWALIGLLIDKSSRRFLPFLLGPDSSSRKWRAGGILISCLADVPMIVSIGGLPIGRFMC